METTNQFASEKHKSNMTTNNQTAASLATQTMLVAFTTGLPRQSTQLKQVATEIEHKNHAQAGTVKSSMFYFKRTDPQNPKKEIDGLGKLKSFQSEYKAGIEVRARYPYSAGLRLLPAGLVAEVLKIKELFDKRKQEVWLDWIDNDYPAWYSSAPERMGTLFDKQDFPSAVECMKRFACTVDLFPMGTAQQLQHITLISQDHAKLLAQSVDDKVKASVDEAHIKLWQDVITPINHMVDVLKKDKAKIYDSMLGNIHEILNLVPSFSGVVNDTKLQDMAAQAKTAFAGLTTEDIRKSDESKQKALTAAQSILTTFAPFQRKFAE